MIRNYIQLSLRFLQKYLGYSLINILGLSVGISLSGLLLIYVNQEYAFDRHIPDHERIYRLGGSHFDQYYSVNPRGISYRLKADFAGIEAAMEYDVDEFEIIPPNAPSSTQLHDVAVTDQAYFELLPANFVQGDPQNALTKPSTVVLTEPMAQQLFGQTDVLGRTLDILDREGGTDSYVISGVVKPSSQPVHYEPKIWLHPKERLAPELSFRGASVFAYVKLKEGYDKEYIEASAKDLEKLISYPNAEGSDSFEVWHAKRGIGWEPVPLAEVHFHRPGSFDRATIGNETKVQAFLGIGLAILVLAIFNFVNLQTALGANRAREIGVRKTLGGSMRQLRVQFISETILLALLCCFLGLVLAEGFALLFSRLLNIQLWTRLWESPQVIVWAVGYSLVVGIMAGVYPAFILSRFKPASVLKGKVNGAPNRLGFRAALIAIQFAVTLILTFGVLIVRQQINYLHKTDIGLDRSNTIVVNELYSMSSSQIETLKGQILGLAWVEDAQVVGFIPGKGASGNTQASIGTDVTSQPFGVLMGKEGFEDVLGFQLLQGHWAKEGQEPKQVVINQSAAALISGDPLGTALTNNYQSVEVVGVVADFILEDFQGAAEPAYLIADGPEFVFNKIAMRIKDVSSEVVRADIQNLVSAFTENVPEISYSDTTYAALLSEENLLLKTLTLFGSLAIALAVLGLFGVSAFMAAQQNKNVGIRKVLGATMGELFVKHSFKYAIPVGVAILVSVPVSWYISRTWLANFQYQAPFQLTIWLGGGLFCLLMAWVGVAYNTWKVSKTDPIQVLRKD